MPRVALGLPLHNGGEHLADALESLLAQTSTDFALVVVDDASTDGSDAVAREVAARDPRVTYERNPQRVGLVENWRRAYERARATAPDAELFAWVGDHDRWDPRWLERLTRALDEHPNAVTAYPESVRLGEEDATPRRFTTAGIADPAARVRAANRDLPAGDMVYGLHRVSALERAGVFRAVLAPDKLLLTEMALEGEMVQVPEVLWYRRFRRPWTPAHARRTLFAGRPPLHAWLPHWWTHAAILGRRDRALALDLLAVSARRRLVNRLVAARARVLRTGRPVAA
jgi:glycosyltransferase involved in cell wall biosynthesis